MAGDSTTSDQGAKEHWGSFLTMPATKVSESEMAQTTNRYTDDEWSRFISEVQESVKVKEGKKYPCPPAASKELAKTIDHTLLKLEAKRVQFDALCAEARVDGFAVRGHWWSDMREGTREEGLMVRCRLFASGRSGSSNASPISKAAMSRSQV